MDKILIVDSMHNTELLRKCLSNNNCEIYTSESGHNALAKIDMFMPDLVIMEANLLDISGYDICKRVKSNENTQHIIFLLLSSIQTKETRIRAFEVGADDFIEKTFDSFVLVSKVKSLLRVKYLREQLKQKYVELEETNHSIALQLEMAKNVQRSLMPDLNITNERFDFAVRYMPALDIGGDFYDAIVLNADLFCIIMGDVSGHGISASLLTAMLRTMIRSIVSRYSKPDMILSQLNNEFCNAMGNNEVYACVFIVMLDTKNRRLYYSNAGHVLPLFVSNERAWELEAVGVPIGLMHNSNYDCQVMNYIEGDKLFFYTDGLSDVYYKNNPNEFLTQLKEILITSYTNASDVFDSVLDNFYVNPTIESHDKFELDDVSIISCLLK